MRVLRRYSYFFAVLLSLTGASLASAQERVHTVYAGQRLGSIAKRYNVSIDEICEANGIQRNAPIHPGQKLIIPDKNSKRSSSKNSSKGSSTNSSQAPASAAKSTPAKPAPRAAPGAPSTHTVTRGQTLSSLAKRYGTSIEAICYANDISEKKAIRVGQKLLIPHKNDPAGEAARRFKQTGSTTSSGAASNPGTLHTRYKKAPWRRGYITLQGYNYSWKGYVIGPKGEVLPQASNQINRAMGTRKGGPRVDARLIRLLAQVSDYFGGRPLRIVSGYRTKSFVADSKHKHGQAVDFSVHGVPNEALRDYLRTFKNVGVGYYPNSSFVHLDVRASSAYWVDYAGPGEAPRKTPHRTRKAPAQRSGSASPQSSTKSTARTSPADSGEADPSDESAAPDAGSPEVAPSSQPSPTDSPAPKTPVKKAAEPSERSIPAAPSEPDAPPPPPAL